MAYNQSHCKFPMAALEGDVTKVAILRTYHASSCSRILSYYHL